jgi:succinate dehydrogenase / fumarate reductase flavoprotein subunit
MHGANRLGGNSLSDLLVFGERAGQHAAAYAAGIEKIPDVDAAVVDRLAAEAVAPFETTGGENPYAIQRDLQECMQNLVGIIRVEDELDKALEELAVLDERSRRVKVEGNRQYNPGWHLALDLSSMLAVSECVTRAARERRESRGAQTRDDYPDTNSELAKVNVVVRQVDGEVSLSLEPLPVMPDDLRKLLEEQ